MTPRARTLADIGLIALRHGLTRHDLLGRSRKPVIVKARKQCYQMLRSRGFSYPQIGALFDRHHSTIMDSCPKRTDEPSRYSGATAGLI